MVVDQVFAIINQPIDLLQALRRLFSVKSRLAGSQIKTPLGGFSVQF
jgi:hypothetical protein